MPSSLKLDILPEAEDDIAAVLQYSLDLWGSQQSEEYGTELYEAIESLRMFPEQGRSRPDIFDNARTLVSGKHVIYYRIDGQTISIVRVLHSRLDISRIFQQPT
jgi:toxin ParE1/3/4